MHDERRTHRLPSQIRGRTSSLHNRLERELAFVDCLLGRSFGQVSITARQRHRGVAVSIKWFTSLSYRTTACPLPRKYAA